MSGRRTSFFERGSFDRLTSGDALFLDVESSLNSMLVAVCLIFEAGPMTREDGQLDFKRIRTRVASRIAASPLYRRRLAISPLERRPVWVDDADFDLGRHVSQRRLTGSGGREELQRLCAEIAMKELDRDHPLWELSVIDGLEKDRFALFMKAHHCMVDGIAGMQLLQSLLDVEPTPKAGRVARWRPRRSPHALELAYLDTIDRLRGTAQLTRDVVDTLWRPRQLLSDATDLAKGLWQAQRFEVHPASDSPLNHPMTAKRRFVWCDLEMARVEEIRRAKGGTLNDVVVATLTLALTRIFQEDGLSVEELLDMDFRVTCPVNTRPRGLRSEVANQISMFLANLPVGEVEPLVVLDRTREALAQAKDSHMADALESVLRLGDWMPRVVSRQLVRRVLRSRAANIVVTNVPGPSTPRYLMESRLVAIFPVVPLMPGHSIGVAVVSYAGRLHWGLNADSQAVHHLEAWAPAIIDAFEDLHAAATGAHPYASPGAS